MPVGPGAAKSWGVTARWYLTTRNRTKDTLIYSQMLYQLSYGERRLLAPSREARSIYHQYGMSTSLPYCPSECLTRITKVKDGSLKTAMVRLGHPEMFRVCVHRTHWRGRIRAGGLSDSG